MATYIEQLAKQWEQLARENPLWAILSQPERHGGRWEPEEFFETGRREVERILQRSDCAAALRRGRALDFGCGVGRLTQALAEHFQEAEGVDIAAAMVRQARAFNRHGERCRYHHNPVADLSRFEAARFDFVLSAITLQHVEPEYAKRYLGEFARVLKPGGLLYFQLPSGNTRDWRGLLYRIAPARLLPALFRWKHGYASYEMHAVPREAVIATLEEAGCDILETSSDASPGAGWVGGCYLARRSDTRNLAQSGNALG